MFSISFHRIVFAIGICWIVFLFGSSLYSPPSFNSDPGLGFLDLLHFSEGGRFQYHLTPSMEDANICIEERTTWWSPGQWFFVYLFTLLGMPLGVAISVTVFVSVFAGWQGWMLLYRRFGFDERVVLLCGLLILFSRYLYTSFQIYPGATILEFAFAPWMLLFWFRLEQKSVFWQLPLFFLLLIGSYFVKSSMLIFWLGVAGSAVNMFQLRETQWFRLFLLALVFVAGKYSCDALFTGGGLTPFSFETGWLRVTGSNFAEKLQQLLFTLQGPFLATLGFDDYIKYVFQKPGRVIFADGHPAMLFLYGSLLLVFLLLARYVVQQQVLLNKRYRDVAVAVTAVFIAFFFYAFVSGKNINGYEESRHFRLAGLVLLPLLVQWMIGWMNKWVLAIPFLLFAYAVPSYFSKLARPKVLSDKLRIPRGIQDEADHLFFVDAARKADLIYVINAEQKYELDHCKTIYNQDDFTTIDVIRSRPKTGLRKKTIVFLLPERFGASGKKDAILGNFIPGNDSPAPPVKTIRKLGDYECITVQFF